MSERRIVHGPSPTEHGDRCVSHDRRCAHYSVHDWHYFYCAAQPVAGQTYPWPGAGTQLHSVDPRKGGCPYLIEGDETCATTGKPS